MRLTLLPLLGLLGGCIIVDTDYVGPRHPHHHGMGQSCADDAPVVEEEVDPIFLLTPYSLGVGETAILSLSSDPILDYSTISEIQLYGDATVCATEPRNEELLVTVAVSPDAAAGWVDMITVVDGVGYWTDGALEITDGDPDPATGEDADGDGSPDDAGADGPDAADARDYGCQ